MKTAVILIALLSAAPAQSNQPATVIRTESRMVQVDTVVTDHAGNPISGLTANDFRLWEDNKEQKIASVSLEDHSGAGAAPTYTLLLFNNMRLYGSGQARMRQVAAELAGADAGPQNLFAVAEYYRGMNLVQNFTADGQRLHQVIAKPHAGQASASGAFWNPQDQNDFLHALTQLAASLRDLPGRKAMVLFSSGIGVNPDHVATLSQTLNVCNRVNLSIYPLESTELSAGGDLGVRRTRYGADAGGSADSSSFNDQLLHSLAKGTGGYVLEDSNDLSGRLARVLKEESGYYLLAYTPPGSPEGSCHALRVRVSRAAEVRSRSTYCNTRPPDLLAGKPIAQDLESRLTDNQPGNLTASMQLPYLYAKPGVALVNVAMEVPSSVIQFDKVKGRLHGEANVLGIAYAADGTASARFSDTVPFDFADQQEVDYFHSTPLHYEKQVRIASGAYTFKVVFAGKNDSAKIEAPLAIDPFPAGSLMLSGLVLSREMRPATDLGGKFESELMDGRKPLLYRDGRVVPFGGNQFRHADSPAIYLEIYDPDSASPQASALNVRTRVFDRKTGAEKLTGSDRIESTEVAGNRAVPYAFRFQLQTLPPAWYTAEVTVTDSAGRSMKRTVDFEVRESHVGWKENQ